MSIYEEIIAASLDVDKKWSGKDTLDPADIRYPVPPGHFRYNTIHAYTLTTEPLSRFQFEAGDLILVDRAVKNCLDAVDGHMTIEALDATESGLKEIHYLSRLLEKWKDGAFKRVIGIGGGIMLNISAYTAEQLRADLVLMPTTVIAMADASIGGKVRVNKIDGGAFTKHFYKTFYEPSRIIIDPAFLGSLSDDQIRMGLAETIKHALYQSEGLASYLLSDTFLPFVDRASLLKAILWTADLKRICLEKDPEESPEGSYKILRAAHGLSDKLEEESGLTISHGEAVLRAMRKDLQHSEKYSLLEKLYKKCGIKINE